MLYFSRMFLNMPHNVWQYETVGFSERVPIHRWKKFERAPNFDI